MRAVMRGGRREGKSIIAQQCRERKSHSRDPDPRGQRIVKIIKATEKANKALMKAHEIHLQAILWSNKLTVPLMVPGPLHTSPRPMQYMGLVPHSVSSLPRSTFAAHGRPCY